MKKLIVLTLAVMMLVSLASCGLTDTVNEAVNDAVNDVVNDVVNEVTEQVNKDISRGVIVGDVYTSDYSGITFTKPSDWVYSTDEELAQLVNTSLDNLNATDMAKTLAELGSLYDMMVTDTYSGTNVIVAYENLSVTNAGKSMSETEYLEALKTNLSAQTGMGYEFVSEETVYLSGNSYLKATFSVDVSGVSLNQVYYLRDIDGIMNSIIVTPVNGYYDSDIEAMFS